MDRFDEMAVRLLGIDRRPPDELLGDGDDHGTMSVRELAAALRETDRRAREEERGRCAEIAMREALAAREIDNEEGECSALRIKLDITAIREGADACGTDTAELEVCVPCRGSGKVGACHKSRGGHAVTGPNHEGIHGCYAVPCPACQGCDDA